jgi:hypothetical protein
MIARRIVLLSLAVAPLFACMHRRWTVVHQASPPPYDDATTFTVEPLHYETAVVEGKSEPDYAAAQTEDLRNLWQTSKSEASTAWTERIVNDVSLHAKTAGDANAFVIRPILTRIEPGSFAGVTVQPTEVRMTLLVIAPNGQTVDEVHFRATVPAGSTAPTIGGRLRSAATELGAETVEYLVARTHG